MTSPIQAIAVFDGKKIKGTVLLIDDLTRGVVHRDIDVKGLKKNSAHGFHVHEAGDLTDQCTSMCAHFPKAGRPVRNRYFHATSKGWNTPFTSKRLSI